MSQWVSAFSPWQKLAILCLLLLVYWSSVILYRLFFHPLRSFPGEKLAAISGWHWDLHASEADYLERLHKKYGKSLGE